MRYLVVVSLILLSVMAAMPSCNKYKYKDADPVTDPRLSNPYCNDPAATNYNWGFPGKPDNSVCFYNSSLFVGRYKLLDSVYITPLDSGGLGALFLGADSFDIEITALDNIKISLAGFCANGNRLTLSARNTYLATVDSTLGDTSTLTRGQPLCRLQDTVTGTIVKDRIDTGLLHITLQIISDTGVTTHTGDARKR